MTLRKYTTLRHAPLPSSVTLTRPYQAPQLKVTADSPAIEVMTDLYRITPVTVGPDITIEHANSKMIDHRVRLLFVTDDELKIQGIVTATDILGEKPMAHIQRMGGTRSEILVKDLMTPQASLQVLNMADVHKARVGDIVATLKEVGRQHTLVVEYDSQLGGQYVRGLFSTTQIGKQLGTKIEVGDVAKTFAALERVLAS
ncbi:MAG TPA: CBS domain-containing protein [Gammaproteobacteria bacterium]|nr:CBS domain-containing protein [Gammaproteobacteria bacterium]